MSRLALQEVTERKEVTATPPDSAKYGKLLQVSIVPQVPELVSISFDLCYPDVCFLQGQAL